MKKFYTLLLSGILLTNLSFAQQDLQKNEVYSKILSAINKYQQVSNFSRSDINSRESYERNFKGMFIFEDQIINDLPLPEKTSATVTADEYLNLLYNNFRNGLTVEIETDNIEINYEQNESNPTIWNSEVAFMKKLSGMVEDGSLLSLSVKVQLDLVLSGGNEFLITTVRCPEDMDADGFKNIEDECPEQPGFMTDTGCPDSDGDKVPDYKDKCPNTPQNTKVDKFGCEKFKFFKDITYQVNFLPGKNRLSHFQAKDKSAKNFYINDFEKYEDGAEKVNSGAAWPFTMSFNINATKPVLKIGNNKFGVNAGIGIYNFKSQLFVYEVNDKKRFPAISGTDTLVDYEKSNLSFIGLPLGVKFYNNSFYAEGGIVNLLKIATSREVFMENKETLEGVKQINSRAKSFKIAPYLGAGITKNITEKLGLSAGLKYMFLNNFNDFNNVKHDEYNKNNEINVSPEKLPAFIGMVENLSIHSIQFDLGITYNLN